MDSNEIVENAYTTFSNYQKPLKCTIYDDLEDAEFNSMLLSTSRRALSSEQIGTVAWGPIGHMTGAAIAHFMPRFIELAVTHALDKDGAPFFCLFTHYFYRPIYGLDKIFQKAQKKIMAETFKFLCDTYKKQLAVEGWLDEAQEGVKYWKITL